MKKVLALVILASFGAFGLVTQPAHTQAAMAAYHPAPVQQS